VPEPFIQVIIETVARYYNVDPLAMVSKDRHLSTMVARHTAMYVARVAGKFSYPQIGDGFRKRDHSTIMSACRRMEQRCQDDAQYARTITDLVNEVRGVGLAGGPVKIRPAILTLLQDRVEQGIYARSVEELVDRVLCDYFQRELKR